ncbi:hypothetical protein NDU88_012610 [Pleurodeles waltl]|uniref:Uncharacterized protein n=1 Tax=Pleurodeles waltl TaxID=8319 RepID=A0AAV7R1Y0_PLEWA|nr:hypothetical protein NDU88_012610 [Pleurodeles waltl]
MHSLPKACGSLYESASEVCCQAVAPVAQCLKSKAEVVKAPSMATAATTCVRTPGLERETEVVAAVKALSMSTVEASFIGAPGRRRVRAAPKGIRWKDKNTGCRVGAAAGPEGASDGVKAFSKMECMTLRNAA